MDKIHVENEIVKEPKTAQEETAAHKTGNDLPGTSGYSNYTCPPPSYVDHPTYFINGCNPNPPFSLGPNLPERDEEYRNPYTTEESIKLTEACSCYLGALSIAFITASFLTFYYYVFLDVN